MVKGWVGESTRHSMSAYGIKTGRKAKPYFIKEPFGLPRELQPTGKFRRIIPKRISKRDELEIELENKGYEVLDVAEYLDEHYQNGRSIEWNIKNFKKFMGGQ